MMLKFEEANYLSVCNKRRLFENCPPHFECIDFNLYTSEKKVSDWIFENTEGRFWLGQHVTANLKNDSNRINYRAGFEISSEASYFALMMDQFNYDGIKLAF